MMTPAVSVMGVILYFVLIHSRSTLEMLHFLAITYDCPSSKPPWDQIRMRGSDLSLGEKESINREENNM